MRPEARKGRGASSNRTGRFESLAVERVDDGWGIADEEHPPVVTTVLPEPARSVITRNNSPDIPFDLSINPYRGCEHGCVYCLEGETRILMADGSFKPLASVTVGDEIYGTAKSGHYRKYVHTKVLAHWRTRKPAFCIRLADGTELVASGDHRFLTERGWKYVTGPATSRQRPHLTVNDSLLGFGKLMPAPAARASSDYRRGYLSGLIRSDGHLGVYRYAGADFEALDAGSEVRRRIEEIRTSTKASVAAIARLIDWPERRSQDWFRGYAGGMFDAEGSFTGDPSIQRKRNIDGQSVKSTASLDVVEIEPLQGERELFDITTGTGDFIANGVISHNCYARPSHQYMNLSAGLDFETRLFYKKDAAAHLREELNRKSYACSPINLGANTDPYQPLERRLQVTRSILEVLAEARHPVTIVTKGSLVVRDLDLLGRLAAEQLVKVFVSVTTLDDELKRRMEPRAASPKARLAAIGRLAAAGIPVGLMYAPVVPAINDHELEAILEAGAAQGATTAGYVLLRLPGEVKDLFHEWLDLHYPERAQKVRNRIRELRGGRDNDPRFGHRMRGQGTWAALLRSRFEASCRKHGLGSGRAAPLTTALFRPPNCSPGQMDLW